MNVPPPGFVDQPSQIDRGPLDTAAPTRLPVEAITGPPGRVGVFMGLTFSVSWLAWWGSGLIADSPDGSPVSFALWAVGGMAPALVALLLAATGGSGEWSALREPLQRWRVGRWFAVLLVPLPVAVAAVLTSVGLGWSTWDPTGLAQWYLLPVMFLGGVVFGGVEEVGWRGFLQPRLQSSMSALAANLLIGVVWALWHAPLFALEGSAQSALPFGWFAVQSVALSVVFGWVRNSTRSTLLVVLLHGSSNASFLAAVQWLAPDGAGAALPLATVLVSVIAVVVIAVAGADLSSGTLRRSTRQRDRGRGPR